MNGGVVLDGGKLWDWVHAPGVSITIDGGRGFGKTHFLVSDIDTALKRGWKVLTNIIFKEKTDQEIKCPKCEGAGQIDIEGESEDCPKCRGRGLIGIPKEKYPSGVYKTTSIYGLYKQAAQILEKDYDQQILVLWDEIQNSAHAYKSTSGMSYVLSVLSGDARKWQFCTVYATPVFEGIPLMIRRFADFRFFKSQKRTVYLNKKFGTKYDVKKGLIFLEGKGVAGTVPIVVPTGRYNRPWDTLEVGGVIYDHRSSAKLTMGPEWFTLPALIDTYGGELSENMAGVVLAWMEKKEAEAEAQEQAGGPLGLDARDIAEWLCLNLGDTVPGRVRGINKLQDIIITAELISRLTGVSPSAVRRIIAEQHQEGQVIESDVNPITKPPGWTPDDDI